MLDFDSSVFVGLIDVSFRRFITPAIIRSLYLSHLFLVVLSVGMLLYFNYRALVASASDEFTSPIISYLVIIAMNLLAFLLLFIWTLIVRLALEAVMVLFRGEEHLRALVELNSET